MIKTYNEWGRLRRVVVGDASHANWPTNDAVFALEHTRTTWKETAVPSGPVPQWIIDEANEDLQILADTLTELGIEVVRPSKLDFQNLGGLYHYCPRDRLLIHGHRIVDPAMLYPCRDMELSSYEQIIGDHAEVMHMPRNQGMILDAANVCRLNDKMLFLESASGNREAYHWLCEQFSDVEIELCNFYAGVHIDSTIVPLREGLVVLNASRVSFDTVPRVFDGWHKVWIGDVVPQGFHQYPYASKWIALNVLVIDDNTVICDAKQSALIQILEAYKIETIPLELRHSRTLGGGFHCVTLDLVRD